MNSQQSRHRNIIFSALVYLAITCIPCSYVIAQSADGNGVQVVTASEIVKQMNAMNEKRATASKAFESKRTYELDYNGFPSHKHAKMIVDAKFTPPKTKQLSVMSEEGSELLRNRVLHKLLDAELEANDRDNRASTALTESNYAFTLLGRENKDNRDCFVLQVQPRAKSKFLYDGKIWIDSQDFAVVHILAQPAKNPSFWIKHVEIEHRYQKIGDLWLPAKNTTASETRLGGHAALSIDYGSYQMESNNGAASAKQGNKVLTSGPELTLVLSTSVNWSDLSLKR